MIAEVGQFALSLALIVAIVQAVLPMIGAQRGDAVMMSIGYPAALSQLLLVGLAFAALTYAFVVSDFSVATVASNSHSLKPMLYKVTGVWANHEGSMLMWVLTLALFGWAVAQFGDNLPPTLRARVLSVQAMIGVAFLAFIIFTSNPFLRLDPAPIDGSGLNPLLQDPGLAFHPPLLYIGYVGFSVVFSFAVAALLDRAVRAAAVTRVVVPVVALLAGGIEGPVAARRQRAIRQALIAGCVVAVVALLALVEDSVATQLRRAVRSATVPDLVVSVIALLA